MTSYKLFKDRRGNDAGVLATSETNTSAIPFDPANADYQAYLKWLSEGNTPEAADEVQVG